MRRRVGVVVALVVLSAACGDDGESSSPASRPPSTATSVDLRLDEVPLRAPEVTGALVADGDALRLGEASDGYYTDMVVLVGGENPDALVVDEGGEPVPGDEISEGMLVDVWIGDGCRESYPVQCDIEAVRIDLDS